MPAGAGADTVFILRHSSCLLHSLRCSMESGLRPLAQMDGTGLAASQWQAPFWPAAVWNRCLADMPIGAKEITQAQLYTFADRGMLYNHNVAPNSGTPVRVDGASVGGGFRLGWEQLYFADLSVAKARCWSIW